MLGFKIANNVMQGIASPRQHCSPQPSRANFMQGIASSRHHCSPTPSHATQQKRELVEAMVCKPRNDFPKCQTFGYITPRSSEAGPVEKEGQGTRLVYGSAFSAGGAKSRRILCYGDSNSIGFRHSGSTLSPYGKELADALRVAGFPCEVTSCGLCGFTSEEIVKEIRAPYIQTKYQAPSGVGLAHLLQEGEFDLVIIMVGTNDMAKSKDPKQTHASVARLHSTCHALGIPTVNIVPPTVSEGVAFGEIRRSMREFRKRLADCMSSWATGCPSVLLSLDCETLVPKIPQLWEPDEIHLSTAGGKQLANKLASQLIMILGQLEYKVTPVASSRTCQSQLQPVMQGHIKPIGSVTLPNPAQNPKRADDLHAFKTSTLTMPPRVWAPITVPIAVCTC